MRRVRQAIDESHVRGVSPAAVASADDVYLTSDSHDGASVRNGRERVDSAQPQRSVVVGSVEDMPARELVRREPEQGGELRSREAEVVRRRKWEETRAIAGYSYLEKLATMHSVTSTGTDSKEHLRVVVIILVSPPGSSCGDFLSPLS